MRLRRKSVVSGCPSPVNVGATPFDRLTVADLGFGAAPIHPSPRRRRQQQRQRRRR